MVKVLLRMVRMLGGVKYPSSKSLPDAVPNKYLPQTTPESSNKQVKPGKLFKFTRFEKPTTPF